MLSCMPPISQLGLYQCKTELNTMVPFLHKFGYKGATIRILRGWSFLEIYIFVGKIGKINKWPQGMVEINIFSTTEVEINII